ncbi:MAG: hypothetical protein ACXU82_05105 [Caulobacteraceae bacterium]
MARVEAYWKGLLRGNASMPFWDDIRLTAMPDLAGQLMLIEAFELPQRFRFDHLGAALNEDSLEGAFIDEIRLKRPFDFLLSQCSATVESASPTVYRFAAPEREAAKGAYQRLLLPSWGEGHIRMLLGIVDFS